MFLNIHKTCLWRKAISLVIVITFSLSSIVPPRVAQAQGMAPMPLPTVMLPPTPAFLPAVMRGVKIDPENPFRFNFIIDIGDSGLEGEAFEEESTKLIKYFLASLTIPEDDLWVNLSPHEKDRIIPEAFGITEMGRDMLAQDYLLKQFTASLMYPEDELGAQFWEKIYRKAHKLYGTTDIPVDTFNKVWIVPDKARIYADEQGAYVLDSRMKVMLEEDYKVLQNSQHVGAGLKPARTDHDLSISTQIIREIIIPEIEKEVNEGKHFAQLRQIYHSLILATWYKRTLKETLINRKYSDQNKVKGVDVEDKDIKNKIYAQYIQAFKQGVYNYIKEDVDPVTEEIIPVNIFQAGCFLMSRKLISPAPERRGIHYPHPRHF